jgi:hypothetical protein
VHRETNDGLFQEKDDMAIPDTPVKTVQRSDSSSGRGILAAAKYRLHSLRSRLGIRGLAILGAAVIAAGPALNWSWLVAIGVAPLLLTALPCVAMCALGLCMMPKSARPDATNENAAAPAKGQAEE